MSHFLLSPIFLPSFCVPLIFNLSALLHIIRSKGSELHDDFPFVAERTAGQGKTSSPTLLM